MELEKIPLDLDILINTFQLSVNQHCTPLNELVKTEVIAINKNNDIFQLIERQRIRLTEQGSAWNEEELKMRFLSFLFEYIDFDVKGKVRVFFERPLSAIFGNKKINVKCDCFFARPYGINAPQKPYFFLQEFKKQKQEQDAEAQMLAAMLIAQQLNENDNVVYGAFLQGKYWTFTTLYQKDYCLSRSFDATQDNDFEQIIAILYQLKNIILNKLN
jgi:hypothetical protein